MALRLELVEVVPSRAAAGAGRRKFSATRMPSLRAAGCDPPAAGFLVEKMHLWALDLRVEKF